MNCEQEGLVVGRSIPSAEALRQIFSVLQLPPDPKTLQIGVGLGYASAVLAHVARQVIGIEKVASLASAAKDKLNNLNLANVVIHQGDGRDGAPQEAPFDIIVVTTPQY